ncbi:MAG: GYD domain-containing protein [Thermodesulfobacteriota bacterium]
MPIYMTRNVYSSEAMSNMIKSADGRKEKIAQHIEQAGGKLLDYYFCFGEYDGVCIYETPDGESALSVLAAVKAMGFVTKMETTQLFRTEDGAEAFKRAKGIQVTPPKS